MNPIRALLAVAVGVAMLALGTAPARAGDWIQVSCVNPDGTAAPSDGWSSFTTGSPEVLSNNDTHCAPGKPMSASLSDAQPAAVGTSEDLAYQPPSGSTLIGGTVNVSMVANATGPGGYAHGDAILYEPAFQYDNSDVFFQCVQSSSDCGQGGDDYAGDVSLPADAGGNFYASAACNGFTGGTCNADSAFGAWALVQVHSARFVLSSPAAPQGTDFGGSALQPGATGTAHIVFTATDSGGPGVYAVTVLVDGGTVWSGTPNPNGGKCVPVGTDPSSGTLMFDWQQPCPVAEVVDAPVPTTGLSDGRHELAVMVTDAAHNSSTVLDQTMTTSNPQTTPVPRSRRAVHARFIISWSWSGNRTTLRSIAVQKLTSHANVAVRCLGRGCPRLKVRSAGSRHVGRLLRGLGGKRFRADDRLRITVTARGRSPERIELRIRDNQLPQARLLKR
jgi:hypothetical protein